MTFGTTVAVKNPNIKKRVTSVKAYKILDLRVSGRNNIFINSKMKTIPITGDTIFNKVGIKTLFKESCSISVISSIA